MGYPERRGPYESACANHEGLKLATLGTSRQESALNVRSHQTRLVCGFSAIALILASTVVPSCSPFCSTARSQERKVPPRTLNAEDVASRYLPGVVLIICDDANGNSVQASGFLVSEGLLVTNYHVIRAMVRGQVKLPAVPGRSTVVPVDAVLDFNPEEDLALLRIRTRTSSDPTDDLSAASAEVAELKNISRKARRDSPTNATESKVRSDDPLGIGPYIERGAIPSWPSVNEKAKVGEKIFALGNPEGLEGTISEGIISGIRRFGRSQRLQITAPISAGSSGGPVINAKGQLIGVVTSSIVEGQNLNFAVPARSVRKLVPRFSESYRWGSSAPGAWKILNHLPTP